MGPFVATTKPRYCGPTLSEIDPDVFRDPATGHWQVYWGSGGDIVTARLAPSLTRLVAPRGDPTLLLRGWSAHLHRPYEHGIEGPYVVARNGWYYLFYSGDNCCSYRRNTPPWSPGRAARRGLSNGSPRPGRG